MGKEKLKFLDGIRGIMALNVILNHLVVVYYPQMYYQPFAEKIGGGLSLFAYTPLSILINGNIAVQYFFVLTGFLVARSFCLKRDISWKLLPEKSVNRYLRLLPLVFLAVLFTYLSMEFGWQAHQSIVDLATNGGFLSDNCNFDATFGNFLKDAFFSSFMKGSQYVAPFWTIPFEFWGYIFCMVVCFLLKNTKFRRLGYVAAGVLLGVFVSFYFTTFFMGAFIADLYYKPEKDSTILSSFYYKALGTKPVVILTLLFGLLFASCPIYIKKGGWWDLFARIPTSFYRAAGCALVLYAVLHMARTRRVLETKPLLWFGEMSFELYAFHWPLMLVVQPRLFRAFFAKMPYDAAALLAFGLTLVLIIGVSFGLHLLVMKNRDYSVAGIKRLVQKCKKQEQLRKER